MKWDVSVSKRVAKKAKKLPAKIQILFQNLLVDLMATGPVQNEWSNYSKLNKGKYHCHLNYRFVAVWVEENKKLKIIEVTYVGSREDAPY